MENNDIRLMAAGSGIKLWQIADALGIPDSSLSRKLRYKLHADEKEKVINIIKSLIAVQGSR